MGKEILQKKGTCKASQQGAVIVCRRLSLFFCVSLSLSLSLALSLSRSLALSLSLSLREKGEI